MSAMIIDGKETARILRQEIKTKVEALAAENKTVTLAVIQVGDDPASSVYVRNKNKACEELGICSLTFKEPAEITLEDLLKEIQELNEQEEVDGILVQLPLPAHIPEKVVLEAISPFKDVDGFHPLNAGALATGEKGFVPGTPAGVIELLHRHGIETEGKECVIVGRSNIVGKPLAQLMLRENATVTVAHSKTRNLAEICRRADILAVAAGQKKMITREYVKPGAVVIDVGIHRDENNKLCGDVDFEDVYEIAGAITPVPGGVGPMTIAMLRKNCLESRMLREQRRKEASL